MSRAEKILSNTFSPKEEQMIKTVKSINAVVKDDRIKRNSTK
jgi:hypothetical protein